MYAIVRELKGALDAVELTVASDAQAALCPEIEEYARAALEFEYG